MDYSKHVSTRKTSQMERTPGRTDEVENSAGGYVFALDDWERLDRFLILGSEGGTFYVSEKDLTKDNADIVIRLAKHVDDEGAERLVDRIVEISDTGRAHKNDAALFALAIAATLGSDYLRKLALDALPKVARTGTMLFQFAHFIEAFGGWGPGKRKAFSNWYLNKPPEKLAYQLLKYRNRNGWSHRDILRLAHPKTDKPEYRAMFEATLHPEKLSGMIAEDAPLPKLYDGFDQANNMEQEGVITHFGSRSAVVSAFGLSHEMLPSEWLADAKVNKVLMERMPLMASIRQLGRLTANGTLKPLSQEVKAMAERLTNDEQIKRSRIHPMHYLLALKTYESGQGFRGSLTWTPIPQLLKALDDGFYKAFVNAEPTGKAFLLGVDVSSSMGYPIANTNISCAMAAGAMAMVIARTEDNYFVHGFTAGRDSYGYRQSNVDGFVSLGITAEDRLPSVMKKVQKNNFGGTDCAIPMLYAQVNNIFVDCFVILTDNETWAGNIKPHQALVDYRKAINPAAKLVVIGMTSTGFSIANPKDAGMLDCVGFDAGVPNIISDFARS